MIHRRPCKQTRKRPCKRTRKRPCKRTRKRPCKRTRRQRQRQRTRQRGGNYAEDVTIGTTEGVATKADDTYTVVMPGRVLSGTAYKNHMEYMDIQGTD